MDVILYRPWGHAYREVARVVDDQVSISDRPSLAQLSTDDLVFLVGHLYDQINPQSP